MLVQSCFLDPLCICKVMQQVGELIVLSITLGRWVQLVMLMASVSPIAVLLLAGSQMGPSFYTFYSCMHSDLDASWE